MGLSLVNLIAVMLWLPESLTAERRAEMRAGPTQGFSFKSLVNAIQRPCAGPLLHVLLFYSLAFTLFQSNFALFTKERLGLDAQATSFVLTYVGVLSVLVQGVAIGKLTDRFSERQLIVASAIVLTLSLGAWSFVANVPTLLVVLAPIALSGGVLSVVLTSQLTKSVYRDEVGGTLGLSSSLQTLAQIVSPGIGGFLLDSLGTWSVGVLAGVVMAWSLSVIRRRVLSISEAEMVNCSASPAVQVN
jgi:DHA1 family tetracycline resistance protein-like MFS transporter